MQYDLLSKKWYLYLTEFFAGMAVMAVELGASRLLAPYFSSSQIVWTIIIGTIMIAMALGSVFGGKWADKDPNPAKLFRRIMIAGIWIALIPVLGKYIILAITGILVIAVDTNLLIWAAFFACMIIFVFPLFLLGTVSPSLIRSTLGSVEESGSVAGRLSACNTIGSILGTFLPTFVTIPAVGTSITFLIFSGILIVLSAMYFLSVGEDGTKRRGLRLTAIALILFIISCVFGHSSSFAFWEDNLEYEGESIYNYLQVKDTDRAIILSTNVVFGVQSMTMKEEGITGMYYDYALAAPVMTEKEDPSILILGMGTGTFASQTLRYLPDASIEGVEIDEKITNLAHEYFGLEEEIPVYTYDGRAFLNATDETYDVIMVDAYQDITIPFQMSSVEFFTMVKEHLNPGGIMVVNLNMHADSEDDITVYLTETIASVFPSVYTADVSNTTNRELFASTDEEVIPAFIGRKIGNVENSELSVMMNRIRGSLVKQTTGPHIFTDDKAPVELLGMRTIDSLIQDELGYYKNIYEEKGLQGILDVL